MRRWLWLGLMVCWTQGAWAADLLWFVDGRPTAQALEAIQILASAQDEGLEPSAYGVEELRRALEAAVWGDASPGELARWDGVLTEAMLRYLHHLHLGRIDPRIVQIRFSGEVHRSVVSREALVEAVRQGRLHQLVSAAMPKIPLYRQIRAVLGQYRRLANLPEVEALWKASLPPLQERKVEPGQMYLGLPLVVRRLKALGDLPPDTEEISVLTPRIAAGLRSFQERHGLLADGILGGRTLARLDVSPAAGVRQMELTMERLRWASLHGQRVIAVYLPENVLEAYTVASDGTVEIQARMRVITGNAKETPTPIFDDTIRAIELSPFWNVPLSIVKEELVPRFLKNPEAFYQEGFEFVLADGSADASLSFHRLEDAARGRIRLRQRPGPFNPMGDIKFVLSNKENIFLHHTANPGLFQRARRDLSHGCIRVEDPVRLAQFVLEDDPLWDADRLRAAMGQSAPTVVRVRRPPRVVLLYATVRVQNGRAGFLADLYGLDRLLEEALRRASPTP